MGRRRRPVDQGPGTLPEAIAALSRSLPAAPSPEVFRRAKFDRPEAAPALWRLLFHLLSPLKSLGAAASLTPEAQARSVKSALRSQGYPRAALVRLPEDGSQGSRELLLALSWLLAREPLIERLLAQTHVQLGDQVPQYEGEALASPGPPAPHVEAEVPVDLRHLQWLMGKLHFRWRHLMSTQQEECTLLSKIHTYTHGCHSDRNLGHLSVTEMEALRDPEGGRQLLQALECENARLQAALEWRRCELVFWQWMDTVLGACPPEGPATDPQPTFLPRIPEEGLGELDLVAQELRNLQEELLEAIAPRRVAWEAQMDLESLSGGSRGERGCSCTLDRRLVLLCSGKVVLFDRARSFGRDAQGAVGGLGQGPKWSFARRASQEAVECELVALRRSWEEDRGPTLLRGPHRLVRSDHGTPGASGLQAAEMIGLLRSQEASRESELRRLQGQCRQELARLTGAWPGLIWILPPRR